MRHIQKLLIKRRMVVCTNCGFLGWQHIASDGYSYLSDRVHECGPKARTDFQTRIFNGETAADLETHVSSELRCSKLQWYLSTATTPQTELLLPPETIRQPRQCPYFVKYQPGYSPEEHKELKRDDTTRRTLVKASLIGALIGAASAIIAQFLYVSLTTPP